MRDLHASALPPPPDLAHAFDVVGAASWGDLARGRVFLTGGTGFVGKWLISTLIEANRRLELRCELVVLSRDPDAFASTSPELASARGLSLVKGDIRSFDLPTGPFSHVIHAATDVVAKNTALDAFDTCVDGTRRALALAKRSGTTDFLLVSSGAVYGRQPPTMHGIREEHTGAPDPLAIGSAYGEGKRVSEWLCVAVAADSDLRVKVARCFAFVGPYLALDKQFAIGNFMRDAMAGKKVVIQGDGTPYRSYLHAADMAAWLWSILLRGEPNAAYNVGGEEAVSIAELARRVSRVLGSSAPVETTRTAPPEQLAERYVPDVTKARTELGLAPPIPLDEAIARTAHWHQQRRPQS